MRAFEQKKDAGSEVHKTVEKEKKSISYDDQKKLKGLNNRLSKAESRITDLEKKIAKMDVELAENYEKLMTDTKWFGNYEKMKRDLEETMTEWEQVQEEIENIQ